MHNFPAALLASCSRLHADQPLGDSSRFSIMQYEDWEDAKRGIVSRHKFVKIHVIVGRRWEEDRALRGYERYGPRLSQVQADVCNGAWRRGVRDA